jgi:hypothetical protein
MIIAAPEYAAVRCRSIGVVFQIGGRVEKGVEIAPTA